MSYIDIHAHILPQLDDGPKTLEESLEMAEMAVKQGISRVVATPHVVEGIFDNGKPLILEKVRELQAALHKEKIPLEIIPGAEVHISVNIPAQLEKKELLTINDTGKYLLLELPHFQPIPAYLENLIFSLSIKGVRTIIPHPERNISVQENPNILLPLIEQGVLMQCTLSSLTGYFGEEAQKAAEVLLKCRMVHLLASDMHSTGGRLKYFQESLKKAEDLVGKEMVKSMITSVPEMILEGRDFTVPVPQEYQARTAGRNLWSCILGLFTSRGQGRKPGI
ncbi:tyrosine-protein phosphatase [Candidatus Contubernalis alkaliaceticus]|uniref:tyrosine-protein phosphatase n=1 Tax=Candidatus Contubernalis alkaliaceticus TaxID=338645 RepID=UPI001F4C44F3|nr:CpsB/CapC family capsule biosynthesis tyrosine phosphatase [Candidatus Contubernalis alkalaceticus]UNC93576.1 phosphotransferase [Candidatus Contubernalis alkalaceticus]